MVYLTPQEELILRDSPIYKKYRKTQWSAITRVSVLADLDAITMTSIEALPLIKFLTAIYQSKNLEDAYTVYGSIETKGQNQNSIGYNEIMVQGAYNSVLNKFYTSLTDVEFHRTALTCVGGTITGAIYAPGASNKFYAYWMVLGTNNTTNPATTYYDVLLNEETSGDVVKHFQLTGNDFNRDKIPVYYKGGVADKDLDITFDNGIGVEILYVDVLAGKATS